MPSIYQFAVASVLLTLGATAPIIEFRQQPNCRNGVRNSGNGNNGNHNTGNNNNGNYNIGNGNNGNYNIGNGNNGNGNGWNATGNGWNATGHSIKNGFSILEEHNPKFVKNGAWAYAKILAKHQAPATMVASAAAAASTGSVAANPQAYDSEYLSPVMIGNQTVKLDFDTGSSDLWVFGESLSGSGGSHTYYYPSSSAMTLSGDTWSIRYADDSSASGNVYSDSVNVGGTMVKNQAVESATNASASFINGAGDGLLGLAFDVLNTVRPTKQDTFFTTAIKQGLPQALFTADLRASAPGTYNFGYIDPCAYSGTIAYTPVDNSHGFWAFTPDSITIGSGLAQPGDMGIADTGTTLMLLSDAVVADYYAQVIGATNDPNEGGYIFPCNAQLPSFTVTVGGYRAVVPGSYINYAPVRRGMCYGGIQSDNGLNFAIYGDVFLKSQFVVFDRTQPIPRLGFAEKA